MKDEFLWVDIGGIATTVRALKKFRDEWRVLDTLLWFVPKRYGYSERTKCVLPVVEALMKKLASKEIPFEPGETMVSVSVGDPRLMCVGVIRGISGESAKRAALCAGGTVCNVLSVDDGRQDVERIFELRRQPLDAVVLAGGVDEGIGREGTHQLYRMAKLLAQALPKDSGGENSIPVIYAASREGREAVMNILGDKTEVIWAENVRSKLEEEYLEPARDAIIQCFAGRVHKDPRYKGIGKLGFPSVFPAGHLLGRAVELIANAHQEDVLALSLDGDQIQVVSRIKKISTRTVTHISSVDTAAVSSQLPSESLLGIAGNVWENLKLRPAALPLDWNETAVFMSFWKEAIRQALIEHSRSAVELMGIHRQRRADEVFEVDVVGGQTILNMARIDKVLLTGYLAGILKYEILTYLVMDGVLPSGVTKVYVDSNNLLPFTGHFMYNPESFLRPLCIVVSPGEYEERVGKGWAFKINGAERQALPVQAGEIRLIQTDGHDNYQVLLEAKRGVDRGDGEGRKCRVENVKGFSRIYLDGRPRPYLRNSRVSAHDVLCWYSAYQIFPEEIISGWAGGRLNVRALS